MADIALRLELASGDLGSMRAELSAEPEFSFDGRGAAELSSMLESSWAEQQERLKRLEIELDRLAADVRLAANLYAATDHAAADHAAADHAATDGVPR